MALRHIRASEREDFEAMLRRLGRAGEFEAIDGATEILAPPGAIGPAVHLVTVKSRRTGKSRTYTSGSSITHNGWPEWVNEVAADIANGGFDVPPPLGPLTV